jgi:hypothetical protein
VSRLSTSSKLGSPAAAVPAIANANAATVVCNHARMVHLLASGARHHRESD